MHKYSGKFLQEKVLLVFPRLLLIGVDLLIYAYRRGHWTETALLKVTSDALLAADQGKLTLLGMLDLSAAFDCVDHDILLNRLEKSFGFFGVAIGWIRSYLTGRKQYVRYSGSMSTVTPMLFGVPQGSVLGPLLFVLYIADAFRIAEELDFSIHGYADDLQIYDHCLVRDIVQLNGRLIHCIDCMGQWMLRNRLKLNASKTEFIWLGSPRRLAACSFDSIMVDGSAIQPSLTVRDLGVILDPAISLVDHVNRLTRTCYFHIRQLRSIRRSLTIDACHALVRAMVLSRLDYCNGLLGGAPKYLLGQLSGVMRAAARLILALPRRSHMTDAISTRLHWLDIPARVVFKLCVLAFRCQHGSAPPYLVDYTSSRLVRLKDGQIYDQRLLASCAFRAPRLWQSAHGHSLLALRLLGTISQWIFVIPILVFLVLERN